MGVIRQQPLVLDSLSSNLSALTNCDLEQVHASISPSVKYEMDGHLYGTYHND